MGFHPETEMERHSRPGVQKRKPKLGWGDGGASKVQGSGQGVGPQSLQCLPSVPFPGEGPHLRALLGAVVARRGSALVDLPRGTVEGGWG